MTSFVQPDAAWLAVGLAGRPVRIADDARWIREAKAAWMRGEPLRD